MHYEDDVEATARCTNAAIGQRRSKHRDCPPTHLLALDHWKQTETVLASAMGWAQKFTQILSSSTKSLRSSEAHRSYSRTKMCSSSTLSLLRKISVQAQHTQLAWGLHQCWELDMCNLHFWVNSACKRCYTLPSALHLCAARCGKIRQQIRALFTHIWETSKPQKE